MRSMLTRCPHCHTVFRASGEQLAVRRGKVRCGACQCPFDAVTYRLPETHATTLAADPAGEERSSPVPAASESRTDHAITSDVPPAHAGTELFETDEATRDMTPVSGDDDTETSLSTTMPLDMDPIDALLIRTEEAARPRPDVRGRRRQRLDRAREEAEAALIEGNTAPTLSPHEKPQQEKTSAEVREEGLEAGLIAARHTGEIPGYSSWRQTMLAGGSEDTAPTWPLVLANAILAILLVAQVVSHFRGEIGHNSFAVASFLEAIGVSIPIAREPVHLAISASELQTLETRNRLQLFLTLQNRAPYAMEWPSLEISLTDAYDTPLVRKVFPYNEYLPRDLASRPFPPGDTPIRLDFGTRDIVPAGYRLYLFYP
jgi:predicted Zn finger-like uncharacterized protein